MTSILNIEKSNNEIINLIKRDEPFSVVRLGIGDETHVTFEYLKTNNINVKYYNDNINLNGIYCKKKSKHILKLFCESYNNAIKNSNLLASFTFNSRNIHYIQNFFSQTYNLQQIHSRSLEPFYQVQESIKPWTHYLLGKKILVINPFIESFKKQLNNGFTIFKDKDKQIFLEGQEFLFYKSFQTIAGNHIHDNWFETFTIMCKDIEKIDFDIALLGCGGYGLPLCNYIKTKLKKSAIYIGGGLQLLFGVIGNRWENNKMWKEIIEKNDTQFIRPSANELCKNFKTIEGGCYW